jgi:hypothetical protein
VESVLDKTRRSRRRWQLLAVTFLPATLAPPAAAAALDYELGLGAFAGFTDNALGVPNGTPGSGSDGLLLGRADAGLNLTRQFSEHRLAYAFTASRYVRTSGGDILSNSLGWDAAFQPLASLRLTSSLAVTQGRLTSLDVASASATGGTATGPTGPRPAAPLLYASADAREGLSWEMSPRWRLLQSFGAQGFWPLEADTQRPSSYSEELGAGLERTFVRDGVSLNLRGLAMQSTQVSSQGVVIQPQLRSYLAEGDLGWRHTFSPVWSDYVSGGGMIVESSDGSGAHFHPAGLAEVSARGETSEISLRVQRSATPNVFAGNIFMSTRVVVNTVAGFGRTQKLQLRGSASFDRASAIGAAGENQGGASVWLAQVVMTYGVPGPILLSLEYSFTDQQADAPGSSGAPAFFSFRRNLIMLGIEVKYASLRPLKSGGGAQKIRGAGNPAEDPRR